jgi:hypothetical protein
MNMNTTESNELTEDELNKLANFSPAISDEEMMRMEEVASSDAVGLERRLCFVACARSADDISELSISEPEAFIEMMEAIEAFKTHAEGLAEIAETAYLRMQIADCRAEQQA